ncbi:MAG: zf-HC2 domain-containing protein [Candidatus Poribacteria bacterium]|nr:zf-HC2 domain-containing protein [Candidatus Poribacteria bacterium]
MRHSQIQKQLSAYLDDALNPQERDRIEIHLHTCRECDEILSDLRQNQQWIANLRQPAPAGIWEAVQEQMENPARRPARSKFLPDFGSIWRRWFFRPASAGVGALVTACLVLALLYLNPTQKPIDDTLDFYLMAHAEYATDNPMTSDATIASFFTEDESDVESADTGFSDDTQDSLYTYLDAYFGD